MKINPNVLCAGKLGRNATTYVTVQTDIHVTKQKMMQMVLSSPDIILGAPKLPCAPSFLNSPNTFGEMQGPPPIILRLDRNWMQDIVALQCFAPCVVPTMRGHQGKHSNTYAT